MEGKCLKTYQGHRNEKFSIAGTFGVYGDSDRAFVASGSEDSTLVIWDVSSKNILQRLEGHEGVVLGVDTHPDSSLLVSGGLDCTVRVWLQDDNDTDDLEVGEENLE